MKRSVGVWQMVGFIFTGVAGTLLHFLYEWTGENPVVGAFSAVNESIREHMKLLFFPMLLFSFIEYTVIGKEYPSFWCVKAFGTLVGLLLIPVLYYTYTGALGIHVDWFNITIFFIAAAVVYWLEARLLKKGIPFCIPVLGLGFLLALGLVFIFLTFFPPALPLFQPPQLQTAIARVPASINIKPISAFRDSFSLNTK